MLFSQSADPVTQATTSNPYSRCCTSARTASSSGASPAPAPRLSSAAAVNDGHWHNVVLTSSGTQEVMYIDGAQVASEQVTAAAFVAPYIYLGSGFLGGSFPDEPYAGSSTGTAAGFNGAMSDAATWDRQLTAAEVSRMYSDRHQPGAAAHHDHPPVREGLRAGVLQTRRRPR